MADAKQSSGLSVWISRHLGAAGALAFIVILGLGYAFLFAPQLDAVRRSNRLQQLAEEKRSKTEVLAGLRQLEENFRMIPDDDVRRVSAMIPREDDLPGIITSLEAASRNAGVTLSSVSFSTQTRALLPGTNISAIQMNLQLSNASYDRFKLFLEALERHLRLFDIQTVNMAPATASYTLRMRAYVQAPTVTANQ